MCPLDAHATQLLPAHVPYPDDRIAYIDAEDPNLSSWCRYVNHARADSSPCNVIKHVDGMRGLVWLATRREVRRGEELQYDYWERSRLELVLHPLLRRCGVRQGL